jgi:TusA-related sulfurtransferase
MREGDKLSIVTDDPRAEREIPVAAEIEGWSVLEVVRDGALITIVIER